ncbi:ATP-binding protein [Caballeronia sp. SBC2]|uniref:ATP-binding protein n=1 Tax=Caballeronia sp. SBC2 TaxID=2705547 RepID=UPI00351A3E40
MFVTQTDLLKKLHAARATGMYERKSQQFVRVPLLIFDDFALKRLNRCAHHATKTSMISLLPAMSEQRRSYDFQS